MNDAPSRLIFLDGIRGWASLSVVLYHLLPTFILTNEQQATLRWLMPPMDGALAVYVFFVVSGFSLSIAYVRSSSKRGIASLAVRRYPRLAIPVLAASVIGYLMMRAGINEAPRLAALTGHINWPVKAYQFPASLIDAIRFGAWDVFFNYSSAHTYSPVLWTMSVELAGSAVVLSALAVFGRSKARWLAYLVLWGAFAYWDSPLSAFVSGVLLAEIHDYPQTEKFRRSKLSLVLAALAIATVWFVSAAERQFYATQTVITLLGTALVAAVSLSEACSRAMTIGISRSLGHLSFPLYLTHSVILCVVASRIGVWLLQSGANGYLLAAVETITVVPLCMIVARLFAPVETFAINFGKTISDGVGLSAGKRDRSAGSV